MYAISEVENHIHFFISISPSCFLSDWVRDIKKSSNALINENKFSTCIFQWQAGFGSFSYGHSQVGKVVKYVMNQKEHHNKRTFKSEYLFDFHDQSS